MGLNVVVGCRRCRVQAFVFRGHGAEIEQFYYDHWDCVRKTPGHEAIVISDDQTAAPWVDAEGWEEITLPALLPHEIAASPQHDVPDPP